MKTSVCLTAFALTAAASTSQAHVTLEQARASAGSTFKAVMRVGHGCPGGEATHTVSVQLPAGLRGAKPIPKAGWALTLRKEKLAQPYDNHGQTVTEEVTQITWAARTRDDWLADSSYDEFVVRAQLPKEAGPLWFKVKQVCERQAMDWAEVPASGTSTKGLKAPAALLQVVPADEHAGHQH